jgi:nitroreductase
MPAHSPKALAYLTRRRSYPAKFFTAPFPDRAALETILTAALRVPDHGKLEPWRLIVLGPQEMAHLADLAAARAHDIGADAEKTAKARGQYDLGRCAVVVISAPLAQAKVPPAEQVLSAGALCMNILHAATASGWGANWLTGWPAHDASFTARAFACTATESVAGIIHIGTPGPAAPDRPRPSLDARVSWGLPGLPAPHEMPGRRDPT